MEENKDIDKILQSLDGIQKASPGHFFYTRVQARLQKEEKGNWAQLASFLAKPRVALSTLFIICLLNAAALFYQRHALSGLPEQTEQGSADDYNTTLAANTYYDENTEAR